MTCACGNTLDVIAESEGAIESIANANGWKLNQFMTREGIRPVACFCPPCIKRHNNPPRHD